MLASPNLNRAILGLGNVGLPHKLYRAIQNVLAENGVQYDIDVIYRDSRASDVCHSQATSMLRFSI